MAGAKEHEPARRSRRRQAWYGLKRPVKRVVSLPGVNQAAHAVVARRRGVETAARLPAPLNVKQVEGRVQGLTFTMNDPARCIIAKELYWGGGRRPRPQDQYALEVFALLATSADIVLDVGSYTGVFSVVAAKANRAVSVHAFDIVPSNVLAAWSNIIANDLIGRVEVHLHGVGEEGAIRMPAVTHGSALPDFWSLDDSEGSEEGVSVPVHTLDHVLGTELGIELEADRSDQSATDRSTDAEAHAPTQQPEGSEGDRRAPHSEVTWPTYRPEVLIKVDVEGHEAALVTAGRASIREIRPTFLMEVLPDADVTPLVETFAGQGYRFYLIMEDRIRESVRPRGEDRYRDWLITTQTPEELDALGIAVTLLT
ncbi:MAG: hypothetical protein GXY39_11095 [Actinomycetales bacterium]|nr:50S ribosomal protein L11 methyltransferase [Tetrasphaera sp.]NLX00234.1 hypothetical protein [Actinomycetales bacterium]